MAGDQALHAEATDLYLDVAAGLCDDDLARGTPCTGWTVADVLAHQVGQELGFATAYAGRETTVADWDPVHADDPVRTIRLLVALTHHLGSAASDDDTVLIPVITPSPIPAGAATRAHQLDLAVHAWDLAVATRRPVTPSARLSAEVLRIARNIPTAGRTESDSLFDAVVPTDDDDPFRAALALLGRDPTWSPATDG